MEVTTNQEYALCCTEITNDYTPVKNGMYALFMALWFADEAVDEITFNDSIYSGKLLPDLIEV